MFVAGAEDMASGTTPLGDVTYGEQSPFRSRTPHPAPRTPALVVDLSFLARAGLSKVCISNSHVRDGCFAYGGEYGERPAPLPKKLTHECSMSSRIH